MQLVNEALYNSEDYLANKMRVTFEMGGVVGKSM